MPNSALTVCINPILPEVIQVFSAAGLQFCAHFQPVGLHEVERFQYAVQAGEDAQMLLGILQIIPVEIIRIQSGVHVTLECQDRLLCVAAGKRQGPGVVTIRVQLCQLRADAHQLAQPVGFKFA